MNSYSNSNPVDNTNPYLNSNPVDNMNSYSNSNPVENMNPYSNSTPVENIDNFSAQQETNKSNDDLIAIQNNQQYKNNLSFTGIGKLVAFIGTSKNGTSFIVNNLAQLLSQSGINVAILDVTKNKNSYYMFTDNNPELVKVATDSIKNLSEGRTQGLKVNAKLTVYTSLPGEIEENDNPKIMLQTLSSNYDVTLIDCDFKSDISYFTDVNEIYLVQSMDALTIQPLTQFLNDLKNRNLLVESKLRVIINKYVRLKMLNDKMIIAGMSRYNEPSMTLQKDLFNRDTIKYIDIPFEMQTYERYLEEIALCQISINGYSQQFIESLNELKNMVYPLISGRNSGNYEKKVNSVYNNYEKTKKHGFFGLRKPKQQQATQFSGDVNDTLNKMRSNF